MAVLALPHFPKLNSTNSSAVYFAALQIERVPEGLSCDHGASVCKHGRLVLVAVILTRLPFIFEHVPLEELNCKVLMRLQEHLHDQLVDPAHHDERLKILLYCELTTRLF